MRLQRLHGLEGELERSLRDQFAAAALTGLLANANTPFPHNADGSIANAAFDIADNMIARASLSKMLTAKEKTPSSAAPLFVEHRLLPPPKIQRRSLIGYSNNHGTSSRKDVCNMRMASKEHLSKH